MKKSHPPIKNWIFISLGFTFLAAGFLWAIDSGARFSAITGTVEVRPGQLPERWKFAKFDTVLKVEDHIRTGEESSAILSFADMSTFVLKAESEIVISTSPEKDSKVGLFKGSIWVNVKKMMKDGSMEIEMTQVVAGIKGTNITCSSKPGEDRIQVLRGEVEALIKSTSEKVRLKEGEELVVKKGGKTEQKECTPEEVQKEWKKELSTVGETIDINEVPDTIKNIRQTEEETFKDLSAQFKTLSGAQKVTEKEEAQFQKSCERFLGALSEHQILFGILNGKIDKAQGVPNISRESLALVGTYRKMLSEAITVQKSYMEEIQKFLKVKLAKGPVETPKTQTGEVDLKETPISETKQTVPEKTPQPDTSEIDQFASEISSTLSELDSLITELSANPSGNSQDWFKTSSDRANEALNQLSNLSPKLEEVMEKFPQEPTLRGIQKQISSYQTKIGSLIKDFGVVEIDPNILTEMSQNEETMADAIIKLKEELDSYNTAVNDSQVTLPRLQSSLRILNNFSQARRQYLNNQKLYESTIKSVSSNKYKTREQEELEQIFERVSNTYQQLGIVIEQLQSRLRDLESQSAPFIK